jgi:c-di-GMP-binding flagellar brake protein YcgR
LGILKQTPSDQEDGTDTELVRIPEKISTILDEINRHLVLIGVRLDSDGPLYNSLLVRLDPIRQKLYLDELNPLEEQQPLRAGQDLCVYASLRGIAIRFSMAVEDVLLEDEHTLYVGSYPSEISYLQRRDIFRVHLPIYDRRSVRLQQDESETELSGQIIDLSVKGFCLELRKTDIDQEQLGSIFRYLGMELPDLRSPLSGEAVLVNLRPSPKPDTLSAGFVIANLDPQTERSLMRATLYYQREAIKVVV